jgi:IMP cyclohydrolase
MAKNPVNHERTKHIDIRYNFVRERVEDKTIVVKYLETTDMLADILTKGLARDQHRKLCDEIGVIDC